MGQAKLVLQSQDGQTSQEVPFTKPHITIGRKPGNDLHFNRAEISGNHAVFEMENNQYYVSDLGSTNGTLLNGAQLVARERYTLQHGDVVTIMPFQITFLLGSTTSETMIEAPKPAPQPQRKGSGTEPDLAAARLGTGTEENKKDAFAPPPPPAAATKTSEKQAPPPSVIEPEPVAEPKEAPAAPPSAGAPKREAAQNPAAAQAEVPEIPKRSALPDYVWLGIGAVLVLLAIGLVVLVFTMM